MLLPEKEVKDLRTYIEKNSLKKGGLMEAMEVVEVMFI
jgi:hypothetical protein